MASEVNFKYVFGPVLSRRLGRSLGVDLVPFKTCTYDCIYCQLGRTTSRTASRKEYVPLNAVLTELQCKLEGPVRADYISLAGSGEPTLYSRLGELIHRIKALTPIPVAVITNGSLLWDPRLRKDLAEADLVIPSLDAGDAASFAHINRPVGSISFETMLEGLVSFRKIYRGQIWLEVFLVRGVTDEELKEIAGHIVRIKPDKVQLNSMARPAPGAIVQPLSEDEMRRYAALLGSNTELIAYFERPVAGPRCHAGPDDMLAIIRRHPCTLDELANVLGLHSEEAAKNINLLLDSHAIEKIVQNGADFFVAK